MAPPTPYQTWATSEFEEVKARLAKIQGRERLRGGRPTLHRRTVDDDDRPVLRRK